MSRTEMYAAPEGGKFEQIAELSNSWGSASRIWSAISERYFGDKMHWLIRCGRCGLCQECRKEGNHDCDE